MGEKILPIEVIVDMMVESLAQHRTFALTVTGTSMSPTLQPHRDRVFIVSKEDRPVKSGEIIFFQRDNGKYILHRVIKLLDNGAYLVNGDGQVWTEVTRDANVIGVVESIQRNGKKISCDSKLYGIYVSCWKWTRPFRRILVKIKKICTLNFK